LQTAYKSETAILDRNEATMQRFIFVVLLCTWVRADEPVSPTALEVRRGKAGADWQPRGWPRMTRGWFIPARSAAC
jgi:hypothetical protein